MKILLVDDRDHELYQLALKEAGYDIHGVSSAREGLKWLESNDVDIVITDLGMPVMDGLTFIENLAPNKHRILVLSGYFVNGMVEQILKGCGVEKIMEKGTDMDGFLERFKAWVAR